MQTNRSWILGALLAAAFAGSGTSPTRAEDATLEALDQKVRLLEKKLELQEEALAGNAKAAVTAEAGQDGFQIKNAGRDFLVKIRGVVQADGRFYLGDETLPFTNTFLTRRVRSILEATVYRDFDLNITPEFAGGTLVVQDAFLDYHPAKWLRLRAGKFKSPVSLEQLRATTAITFAEFAFPAAVAPNRDVGSQLHGDVGEGILNYAVGVFNGIQDGASADTDTNDSKDVAARLFLTPFKNGYSDWAKGLGVGVAGTYGTRTGALPSYRTPGQNTFFTALTTATVDGTQWRVAPQLAYYAGRLGVLAEAIASTQEAKRGTALSWLTNRAWLAEASFLLTGDQASYKGVTPKKPFDPKSGGWGAWELAGRYHELTIDDDYFTGGRFALASASARKASAWAAGVNWYLNKNIRTVVNYEQTEFEGGAARNADRETEKVVFTRFQLAF